MNRSPVAISRGRGVVARWWAAVAGAGILAGSGAFTGRAPAPEVPQPSTSTASAPVAGAPRPVRYGRDIRPLLSDRCFTCHGPDAAKREAKLRLDDRGDATTARKDGIPIVPGDPERSEVWRRVQSHDAAVAMPPPTAGKRPFTPEELDLLRRWIAEGAAYEPHWAFVAPTRPAVPSVAGDAWSRNDIDRFLFARLHEEGVEPSKEADRATLLRRLFLDLTGLPPTPEELDAFLADASADAYERWVDRLLGEEPYRTRFAERMTAPWLDAARYADTCGIHMDAGRSIWKWRDWVIEAYRSNMPFDRFVVEQIAGDLLPDATDATRVASGFHRNHVTTDEGGAIAEEYLVEYAVDRVNTTGSVFLGLTLGCARCHDHKFDPITQGDYYGLYAYFNSIEEPGLYSQLPDPKRAFEPFLAVPTPEQSGRLSAIGKRLAEAREAATTVTPEETAQRDQFLADAGTSLGVRWTQPAPASAAAESGATMAVQTDRSILVGGAIPDKEEYTVTYRVEAAGQRLMMLEALTDPSIPGDRVGRSENGNAVMTGLKVTATSIADPARTQEIPVAWAWADVSQTDGDWDVTNLLAPGAIGWAVGGQLQQGGRVAMFLAKDGTDFTGGFEGGATVTVTLSFRSPWIGHSFGRFRVSFAPAPDEALARLPEGFGRWLIAGPFPVEKRADAFAKEFGPELDTTLLPLSEFQGGVRWKPFLTMAEGAVVPLDPGVSATYVARRIFAPSRRTMPLSLGSDDGIRVYLNGRQVHARDVDRAAMPDQESIEITLEPGMNALVLKIANTGGAGGVYHRLRDRPDLLDGALAGVLAPPAARPAALTERMKERWLASWSPRRRELAKEVADLEREDATVRAAIPLTMVMKERAEPKPAFVLKRGQYDAPDTSRPAARGVPAALGALPEGAAANRLGLARWLVDAGNPLVARVTMNRLWEQVFGSGIVRTVEDFGLQGEWPSHPELLDWLAVEFRESGWDLRHMLRLMVTSAAYRQGAATRPEIAERDPDNRLLAHFPRKRLAAEQIRDQALYVAGLLVERVGGPSVKTYQPQGLWEEVAMIQSNTRVFQRGTGDDLWRRSIYTYWKRAAPPPSMLTFDAPTRESCVVRRGTTNTPLQALALWNDEQVVEASRVLAARTLIERTDDRERLTRLLERCTGHLPDERTLGTLSAALGAFRERYAKAPEDADRLLAVGDSPIPDGLPRPELAAWTLVANAALNLDATITRD